MEARSIKRTRVEVGSLDASGARAVIRHGVRRQDIGAEDDLPSIVDECDARNGSVRIRCSFDWSSGT